MFVKTCVLSNGFLKVSCLDVCTERLNPSDNSVSPPLHENVTNGDLKHETVTEAPNDDIDQVEAVILQEEEPQLESSVKLNKPKTGAALTVAGPQEQNEAKDVPAVDVDLNVLDLDEATGPEYESSAGLKGRTPVGVAVTVTTPEKDAENTSV